MTTAIVYSRSGKGMTKMFRDHLGIKRYRFKDDRWRPRVPNLDVCINWGCAHPVRSVVVYNKPAAIRISSNKLLASLNLINAGIPTPSVGCDKLPCIGRKIYHRGGQNFWFCATYEDVDAAKKAGAEYFSEFYPKMREYRVHVAHGAVLVVQRKVPVDGVDPTQEYAWNHASGKFVFEYVRRNRWPIGVVRIAIQAVECFGLDFGAVDVLSGAPEPHPKAVVCEVNTAPSLADYAFSQYLQYFKWLLSHDKPPDHFVCTGDHKYDYSFSNLTR